MTDSHHPAAQQTIMVVDDNPDVLEIFRIRLGSEGFNLRCVNSGRELFACLEELKPNIIVLDILMPEMDGLEVLRRLKGAPETSSIPVIMLTTLVKDEDWFAAHKLGADYYLPKPFDNDKLLTAINHLLRRDQGRSVESM